MPVSTAVDVSVIAVVIATVGYQVLGALWYGPLFGARWMDAMGDGDAVGGPGDATAGYVMTTVGSLIAVGTLGIFIDWIDVSTWEGGLVVGLMAGVGLLGTTALQTVPFEGRSWLVYLLHVGYNTVAFAGAGMVLVLL